MKRVALSLLAAAVAAGCGGRKTEGSRAAAIAPPPGAPAAATAGQAGERGEPESRTEAGEDVLAEVEKHNSKEFAAPSRKFRKGHVSPRKLPASAVKATPGGFTVSLPSKARITTPAVYDGKVFVSGGFRSKELYAFNARSGKLVWGISLDDDGPSAAACERGVCVINTESCTVFAVDADTGEMLWSWWLGDPLVSTPTIANGLVFVSYPAQAESASKQPPPGASHALAAFDLKTGALRWQKWLDSDVMTAPVAVGDELYATTFAGTVYKLEQESGKFRSARRDRATSAPTIVGDDVFYTRRADKGGDADAQEAIVSFDRKSGAQKWSGRSKRARYLDTKVQAKARLSEQGESDDAANGFSSGAPAAAKAEVAWSNVGARSVSTMQAFQGSRLLHFDAKNIAAMGDECVASDPKTGKQLWSQKLPGDLKKAGGFLAAPPIAATDSILIATLDGNVLRLDPKDGTLRKSYKVGSAVRSQPVIDGGWIYVGTEDGKLVAIDTGDRKVTGWAQWGGNAQHTGIR